MLPSKLQIGINHHPYQRPETGLRFPVKLTAGAPRNGKERMYVHRTEEGLVYFYILFPIKSEAFERLFHKFAYRVRLPAPDDEIARRFLLEHQPHRLHIVPCKSPIALGVKIPKTQFFFKTELDAGRGMRDLACHEFMAPARRFMVEQNTRHGKKPVKKNCVLGIL